MDIMKQTRGDSTLPSRQRGVTMIELMIVIVIVAILASIAVPSYRDYVLRTNRMEAINVALELAACQERIHIKENGYAVDRCGLADSCLNSPNDEYTVCMALGRLGGGVPANQSFTLTATPNGGQASDSCGNMTLTDAGGRGASSATTDDQIDNCWKGRKI
jgi:type IV pilus assembly protein PilE